jgi:hypothetical protein
MSFSTCRLGKWQLTNIAIFTVGLKLPYYPGFVKRGNEVTHCMLLSNQTIPMLLD